MLTVNVLALHAGSEGITASVTVDVTCGFDVTGTLDFANTLPGGSSDTKDITLTNTGSKPITIDVYGTDWCTGTFNPDGTCLLPLTPYMPVGQTTYYNTSTKQLKLSLGEALPVIGNLPDNTLLEHFQMSVPFGQAAGAYQQTVTFSDAC